MRKTILAISLCSLSVCAAYADTSAPVGSATPTTTTASLDVSGPQEVGTTTMPAGNYLITEQTSGKTYDLMVSNKGTMILAPAPTKGPAAAAATPATTTTTGTTSMFGSTAVKGLMQKGIEKGVGDMVEKNATNELGKFLK